RSAFLQIRRAAGSVKTPGRRLMRAVEEAQPATDRGSPAGEIGTCVARNRKQPPETEKKQPPGGEVGTCASVNWWAWPRVCQGLPGPPCGSAAVLRPLFLIKIFF